LALTNVEGTFIDAVTDGIANPVGFAKQSRRCDIKPDSKGKERGDRDQPARQIVHA
jgi:hypothetical protein